MVLWSTMSVANPILGNQQTPSPSLVNGAKDTLLAGNTVTPQKPDPYGFKPLLADNAPAYRTVAAPADATEASSRTLTYSSEAHAAAQGFIREYLKTDKEKLTNMKSWGAPSFNRIEQILAEHNLPRQLEYLAVIESELKHSATSKVGAKGYWQFMPETARLYGLKVNDRVDERTDLDKSTRAAARYLQDLYEELHDWLLVIAAYDGGTARIHSAIRKAGSRDYFDLQYFLAAESRIHVRRFIATNFYMEQVPEGQNLLPGGVKELQQAISADDLNGTFALAITGHYTAEAIAKHLGMTLPEFVRLNPNFDEQVCGTAGCYTLRLPRDKMDLFIEDKNAILAESVRGLLNEEEEPE